MKAKYLLTALALPAMFAACSQEDIVTNAPQGSTEVLGKIAGDVAFTFGSESRLTWGTTDAPAWEANDEFSLFWVDADFTAATGTDALNGMANALYKKDGSTFTSENILYEGKHLMVYPVDKAHLGNKAIVVKVDSIQDGSIALGKRSIYVNDSLLNIKAPLADASKQSADTIYAAGYQQPVKASVKALSSNLVLNLNFDMPSTINEVTVKSVSLIADQAIFPAEGNLTAKGDSVGFAGTKFSKEIKYNMPANTKVTKDAAAYTAQLSLLPIINNTAATYKIQVATNYGIVTIDSAKYVTSKSGALLKKGGTQADSLVLSLAPEFALTKENGPAYTYRGTEIKDLTAEQQSFGKRITANVKVMMSEASISNMKVATSEELIDAYTTYTLLAKTGAESFILSNKKPFELTPAAVAAIVANKKVTLTQEGNDTIKLTGAHTAIPSFIVKDGNANVTLFNTASTKLLLGENTWAIDVDAAAAVNTWAEVINAGTLTISESNPTTGAVALTTPITNWAAASFGSNVNMPVAYNQVKGATITVASTYKVNLNAGGNINGKVDVDGTLAANMGVTNLGKDAEIAVAGSFLTASTGTMHNLGTITLEGTGSTIVSTNDNGTDMGSIVLAKRNSNAKVNNKTAQGYIKWACNEETYTKNVSDVFNTLILSEDFYADDAKWSADIKYIEVAGSKVNIYTSKNDDLDLSLTNVVVKENSTLVVPKGTNITVTGKTVNDGSIEVYGQYIAGTESGKGTIYYYNGQVNVATATELQAVINNAVNNATELIVLTEDIELTAPLSFEVPASRSAETIAMTLNLNGNKIINKTPVLGALGQAADETAAAAIYVNNSNLELTIKGDGEVVADANARYQSAVWVRNGKVIIEGGKYFAGKDDEGNGCTAIQGYAKEGAYSYITIKGGEFSADTKSDGFSYLQYACLNLTAGTVENANTYIKVEGGKFINFNPANNCSEGLNTNFVSTGYKVVAYNETKKKEAAETTASANYDPTWSDCVSYTVVAVTAE